MTSTNHHLLAGFSSDVLGMISEDPDEDEMTVQQLLELTLLKSLVGIELDAQTRIDAAVKNKNMAFRQIVQEYLTANPGLADAAAAYDSTASEADENNSRSNSARNQKAVVKKEAATTASATTTTKKKTRQEQLQSQSDQKHLIVLTVMTGPHRGEKFERHPKPNQPCKIGRSRGRHFVTRGISLGKDYETSTTHGKFTYESGNFQYVDTGSTNGTVVVVRSGCPIGTGSCGADVAVKDEIRLKEEKPFELADGCVLRCGASTLHVSIPSLAAAASTATAAA